MRHRCSAARCGCPEFFFIVAEGSWALRCRCKHKHTEHDAAHARRRCAKAGCTCDGFHSPWVCNCDHPWDQHELLVVEREVSRREHPRPHGVVASRAARNAPLPACTRDVT